MRCQRLLLLFSASVLLTDCRAVRPRETRPEIDTAFNSRPGVGRFSGVFADSVTHARYCEPVAPGADWRRICTLRNQGVILRRPVPPGSN